MNYYERIQKSIDYIERNLDNEIDITQVAKEAYMSLSNFYRMFLALSGFTAKEYIRMRRIHFAAKNLKDNATRVIDQAVQYDFESADAFSRSFKKITGFMPREFKKQNIIYTFERIDLMDKYFDIQDKDLLEKYPDIKVLKELEPMRVAYYNYYGKNPETNAFVVIQKWLKHANINLNKQKLRIFGYNNPDVVPGQENYGYEVCVTIPENLVVEDSDVKEKILSGGLYAVTCVAHGDDVGLNIMKAWERFRLWMIDSKYNYGGHQWLEEHLGFDDQTNNHIGNVDLYMPVVKKDRPDSEKVFETESAMLTATFTAYGRNAIQEARSYFFAWAEQEQIFETHHRYFAYYNHEQMGRPDFFYKISVTVDKDFQTEDTNIKLEEFPGGYYAVISSKYQSCGMAWGALIQWVIHNKTYDFGDFWFFEEYMIDKPVIEMNTEVLLHMSLKERA